MPCDDDTDPVGFDAPARRLDAGHLVAVAGNAGNLALFDDIDAKPICRPRETPGNGVVTCNAGPTLQRCAEYRIACAR